MNILEYIAQIKSERKQKFFKEALSLGVQIDIVSLKHRLVKFSFGNDSFYTINDIVLFHTRTTAQITRNKELTKLVLAQKNISVPRGIEATNANEIKKAIKSGLLKYPLVIKPVDAAKGVGIHMNIMSEKDIDFAVQNIKEIKKETKLMASDDFLAEEMFPSGDDFRILVFNNKILGCIKRIPAFIVGNGENTISELIEQFNVNRPKNYLLKIDKNLIDILKNKSLTLDTILQKDKKIQLRNHANISSGGIAVDHTQTISKRFRDIVLNATRAINGVFVGIDLLTEDITSNDMKQPYTIIEINGVPEYDVHEDPVVPGSQINIAKILLQYLLPDIK